VFTGSSEFGIPACDVSGDPPTVHGLWIQPGRSNPSDSMGPMPIPSHAKNSVSIIRSAKLLLHVAAQSVPKTVNIHKMPSGKHLQPMDFAGGMALCEEMVFSVNNLRFQDRRDVAYIHHDPISLTLQPMRTRIRVQHDWRLRRLLA
jgi:hypothetical protein